MKKELISAKTLLECKGISLLDAARLICNALDCLPKNSMLTPVQFCSKIIEEGKRHIRTAEMPVAKGFTLYLESKRHLRKDSFNDIRYLGKRLLRTNPELGKRNFSELSVSECEEWLNAAFTTNPQFKQSASQFNKGRTMLHGLFEFALRREWCEKNPIKKIKRRKVAEKEIQPLKLSETKRIIKTAQKESSAYAVAAALLVYTGIRPREVRRLTWRDIDTEEKTITVRSQCSKTGGVRQVEIPPVLNKLLITHKLKNNSPICPTDWQRRWRKIRDNSGFRGRWVQDVLRHTYASFHAKHYADLPRLQLNMGHRDLSLLRSRYVNMHGISRTEAKCFFESKEIGV